ncbi:MAG: undecaprenyl-diphosphate phosphatase, partial [Oscillospiraceae bacterium]|nr:undecaprenyl-diphosphate phosphatase [Oscillospiraceae bacterium]
MAYILAILWGLVQGLTEILPVSGSAHMAILERVLGQTAARTEQRFFYGLLDLALAAAVLIAYRQELAAIIRAFSQKPART